MELAMRDAIAQLSHGHYTTTLESFPASYSVDTGAPMHAVRSIVWAICLFDLMHGYAFAYTLLPA